MGHWEQIGAERRRRFGVREDTGWRRIVRGVCPWLVAAGLWALAVASIALQ